jgi:predicted nucleic acid-binding protein
LKVLVDTSVWSAALRRRTRGAVEEEAARELANLIRKERVLVIGPVRQELLSGISDQRRFEDLLYKLRGFSDEPLTTEHFELAATYANKCRRQGIQGAHTDFLVCAFSVKEGGSIYTLDRDFARYRNHIPITLHTAGDA